MSNTPEKIWAIRKDGGNGGVYTTNENISTDVRLVEYIRADLVTDWMDIKTAPKDGTAILAYWPAPEYAPDAPAIVQTWWTSEYCGWITPYPEHDPNLNPTHWQPLPTPPPAT